MKRLLLVLGAVILVAGSLAVPALAQESGVVTVTIELVTLSVVVWPDTISYGQVSLAAENLTPVLPYENPSIWVYNNGTGWADFSIRGADTDNWTLGGAAAPETYVHYWGSGHTENVTYDALSTDYQDLEPFISHSPFDYSNFYLMIDTPTASASLGTQTTTVTVLATMVGEGISLGLEADPNSFPSPGPYFVTLTANITDAADNPVTGIPSGNFRTFVIGYPVDLSDNFTETVPGVSGIYTGGMNFSFTQPNNNIGVVAWDDASMRKAGGEAWVNIGP